MLVLLQRSNQCALLISEENDDPIVIPEEHRGGYCVTFDPLDGSSNIDCGVSIGTIFGIYKARAGDVSDVLRVRVGQVLPSYTHTKGANWQVCKGVVHGSRTACKTYSLIWLPW